MLGTQIRDLRSTVTNELGKLRSFDWLRWLSALTDYVVRGVMAGLSAKELRAILRGDAPTEKPNPRYKAQVKSFTLHLRPKYYQRGSTWFTHTWRLGWLSVYFFVIETITGVILMLFYAPTPERAYGDMLYLLSGVPYGEFMRDLHRLGAEGMVAVVMLHMVRVYFTGSYKGERAFTWVTGVTLLLITLLLSFSGYLLPWDQLAYWAVTIGTSMAEAAPGIGNEVNLLLRGAVDIWSNGLLRFYLLHVLLMPLLALIVISVHYYKVAREHSISLPAIVTEGNMPPEEKKHQEERIDLIPNLFIHELMLVAVSTFLMVWAVTTFYHAPLEQHADPQITPLHTMAPWYFLWLQGMLKLGDKALTGIILPTLIFAGLFALPWIDRNPKRLARNRPFGILMGILSVIIFLVLSYMGLPQYGIVTPPAQDILSELVPMTHPGPVRTLHWDEIHTGPDGARRTYFVSYPAAMADDERYSDTDRYVFLPPLGQEIELDDLSHNEFIEVLTEFKAQVENAPDLIQAADGSPKAQVTVELIQPDLKRLEFSIRWREFDRERDTNDVIVDADGIPVFRSDVKGNTTNEQVQMITLHKDSEHRH